MPASQSNSLAALKELYTGESFMKDLVYKKNPFYAVVPKDESPDGLAGKYIPVPLQYSYPAGRSATFADAQANERQADLASFFVYRVANYGVARIANDLIEATRGNAGAFVDAAKLQVDGAIRNLANDIALGLFGTGDGSRGRISTFSSSGAGASGTVIVLTDANDVVNFEVGMVLVASLTAGGAVSDDTMTVTRVDRVTGTLTGTLSDGTADTEWAADSYLSVDGDVIVAGGSTSTGANDGTGYLKITGLSGWLPTAVPGTDSFWGVNRSNDRTRLAGNYFDGSAESVEEALIDGTVRVAREGGEPDMAFCTFQTWAALEKELGAKVQYVSVKHDTADIAFKGLTVNAPYGPVTVIPDRSCTSRTIYCLTMESWKLRSLGKCPHILTYGKEGLEGARVDTADSLEVRVGMYGNLTCNAPGWNIRIATSV